MATINVTKCEVSPNDCPLSTNLDISIEFNTDKTLKQGSWKLQYEVDYTGSRHILDIATTQPQEYESGTNHCFAFSVPEVNVEGIKEKSLMNMGLLRAVLTDGAEHVSDVTLVVQVTKENETLMRRILSPIE
jgi:hypothetical protein|uniref:Uncharacterized protein n=1 Tax=Eutreptiella gymnastica TaxID=73025 RepID=A0A7S4GIT2_9EUGL|mmetsp:Transcript_37996/g.63124  ORF Transcript_37996/g.63124 Transcript_37996/m.63124 type:complete len:132 (+) Transcript_37996:34-429(+)|eukprot:CAMPEP_0174289162 /NCGR_PEP_ID=MMETSP0809-20121228/23861_1 /TAXON_ID=73025 ORGANISM="Eutreptiella gymnastica-like, Strain CCMP1594" /NCGR_SAMPLE_ID=MMETSP0809 /ASSEMBLY_ACC=CAM_ASM_000658 /LENGTH=131 /DNA_ID=CAMNT_0015386937 /DNA_START=35 /DNA_END=430 /DNA_ORIENTATION=+